MKKILITSGPGSEQGRICVALEFVAGSFAKLKIIKAFANSIDNGLTAMVPYFGPLRFVRYLVKV